MQLWCKDGNYRAYTNALMGKCDGTDRVIHAGKNMTSAWQILARESMSDLAIEKIAFGEMPRGVSAEAFVQGYITYNDGIPYPDILFPFEKTVVPSNRTQGVIVVVKTSEDAEAGEYELDYTLTVNGTEHPMKTKLFLHDAAVPLPEKAAFDHQYVFNFQVQGGGKDGSVYRLDPYYKDVPDFSEKWHELMRRFAETMKEIRVNSLWTDSLTLLSAAGSKRIGADRWHFDFSRFDELVEIFLEYGSFKYVTIASTVRDVYGEYIGGIDEEGNITQFKIYEEDADRWAKAFITAVREHFAEKGWSDKLRMHIEDEPHQSEYWNWFREKIREYAPEVRCHEPIDSEKIGDEIKEGCEILVPRLDVFEKEKDFYLERLKSGKNHLWCYACGEPAEPWFLNKFVDRPQNDARLIKWACFANGVEGFLHWGFNFWTGRTTLYGMDADARFKGDGFIVYPDVKNNRLLLSNRALATAQGIEDCEILNQLKAKDEEAAIAIARSVACSFTDQSAGEDTAEEARGKVLSLLG